MEDVRGKVGEILIDFKKKPISTMSYDGIVIHLDEALNELEPYLKKELDMEKAREVIKYIEKVITSEYLTSGAKRNLNEAIKIAQAIITEYEKGRLDK